MPGRLHPIQQVRRSADSPVEGIQSMAYRDRFVTKYLNPLEVEAEVANLVLRFPDLCRLEELPFLTHGYMGTQIEARGRHRMHALRITSPHGSSPKPAVLLMRSPHAREWINAMAIVETALQLLENYAPGDPDPRVQAIITILDNAEVMIVPEGNPDGARLSFYDSGQRMWRKNLRPSPPGLLCAGVDCNRNYPRFFGEAGSSPQPCTEIYHGPNALSEPETANISYLVNRHRNIVFGIDSHSHGEAIFRPGPTGGSYVPSLPVSAEDHEIYSKLEVMMNAAIVQIQGVEYSTGSTSNHAGTSDEFLFFDHRVFAFDLECGREFQPPVTDAVAAALEVAAATMALAWCAAGQTDVDVGALLARREALDSTAGLTAQHQVDAGPPWVPTTVPPESRRRLLVRCTPKSLGDPSREALDLLNRGFDLAYRQQADEFDLVVSAEELSSLLRAGYRTVVVKDIDAGSAGDPELE